MESCLGGKKQKHTFRLPLIGALLADDMPVDDAELESEDVLEVRGNDGFNGLCSNLFDVAL